MLIIFQELKEENASDMTTNILKIATLHRSSIESSDLRSDRLFSCYENDPLAGSSLFMVPFAVLLKQGISWDSISKESLCAGVSNFVFLFGPMSAIFK